MIFVTSDHLKPGMVLARDVWGKSSFLPLVNAGNKLTQRAINSFIAKDIIGVYIECECSDDIEIKETMPMEIKVRVTAEIEKVFKDLHFQKSKTFTSIKSLNRVADYLVDVITENDECMINMVDIKNYNEYAYVHSMQVGILCTLMGKKLEFSKNKLKEIAMAGMLHDVGKIGIPLEILDKTDKLTDEEFEIIKQHPNLGLIKLSSCKTLSKNILDGVKNHHEKLDGTGYPQKLKGDEISEFGKIIAVADVYDALTSTRSYREAWESHKAINYMMSCVDTHFDVDFLNIFLKVVAAYPIGVLVKLNNDTVGVVIDSVEGLPLNPIIKVLSPIEQKGKILDLAHDKECLTLKIVDTIKDIDEYINIVEDR